MPPTGVIVVNLPSLALRHGLYRVGVRFQDLATREDYVYLPQAFPFRVVSPHRLLAGLTLLGQAWKPPLEEPRDQFARGAPPLPLPAAAPPPPQPPFPPLP